MALFINKQQDSIVSSISTILEAAVSAFSCISRVPVTNLCSLRSILSIVRTTCFETKQISNGLNNSLTTNSFIKWTKLYDLSLSRFSIIHTQFLILLYDRKIKRQKATSLPRITQSIVITCG